jgi:hypothetical protein
MHKRLLIILSALLLVGITALAQEYVYPNKKLSDQGLLEYRRYSLEEAQAYEEGGSFDPYTTLSWGPERRLTEQENVYRARVVVSGDSLFVAYSRIASRQVYFIRSLNSGVNWGQYLALEDTLRDYFYYFPEILQNASNSLIGAAMQDAPYGKNFGYFRSTDYGETWGELNKIFPYESNNRLHYSSYTNSGQIVYATYVDVHDHDSIYVVKSTDWGDTWNGEGVNVAYLNGTPQAMTVRAWGDNVYLVWVNENQPISCRYSRSTDTGLTWSHEIDISNDSSGAQRVYVAVQDTHVVVCWMGYKYSPYMFTGDLFIKRSFNSGETWEEEQVLTDLHKVMMGSIYIKDSLMVAVWMDARFSGVNDEVMIRISFDYGDTWSDEERISYGDYHSHAPISISTGDKIHVIWGDQRSTAPGLYYCVNDPSTGINEDENQIPKTIYLSSYPNPFNARTQITYNNIEGGDLSIYDITGRLIKTFTVNGREGDVMWDATDDNGNHVSSGVYFIRARTSNGATSRKVLYLR